MATSGTKTWTLYVDEVIDEAMSRIGSEPITGNEAKGARRSLNIMMRDWANRGIQLWTIDEATQTVTEGTANYTLDTYTIGVTEAVISRTENSVRTDFQMERINREDYLNIPVKSTKGRPSQYFLDMQRAAPVVYLYPTPDNSTDVFRYKRRNRIEDITASTESIDIPDRFLPSAVSGLSFYMAQKRPQIDINRRQELKLQYEEEFKRALDEGREKVDLKIYPDIARA
mgnify:CR=1 FL=1|tara:strand:- start:869 stop:1552 length:684 start_codon:yes stop_codon:yes gene_type:complete